MTKRKSTKRALLLSALSLLMCVSMLIGSTFAWFTDSVTSAGNKIQAGNLDVQLLMFNGTEYADISNSTSPIFGSENSLAASENNADTLWEPGKTQVAYLAIKNNGSLALKYTVALNVTNVSKNLYQVMRYDIVENATNEAPVTAWNAAEGKSVIEGAQAVTDGYTTLNSNGVHYFALAIHMNEEAGNEYQGGRVDFDLTITAAQATVESDSFNNLYDEDSTRSSNITIKTTDDLAEAFADAKDGDVLTLANAINPAAPLVFDKDAEITLDLGGQAIEGSQENLIQVKSGNVIIKNGTIKNNSGVGRILDNGNESRAAIALSGDAVVEIKDVVIEAIGNAIVLDDNAKITDLNAKVTAYCDKTILFEANAIYLRSGNARIDSISGGEYISAYTQALIDAYGSGTYSFTPFAAIHVNSTSASIGEIRGGTFLGESLEKSAAIRLNAGKIEKISGGYFGFCKNTMRNSPFGLIFVSDYNGASIDAITGGTFEYASLFGFNFEKVVADSGCTVEKTGKKLDVTVKLTTKVNTYQVDVWNVVAN